MILLDTNVISELWKPKVSPSVERWFDDHESGHLCVSAIALAELSFGASRLPAGRRRDYFLSALQKLKEETFQGRILSFDDRCSDVFGLLCAQRERAGRPMSFPDAAIAAMALTYGLTLATRNVRDFQDMGLTLINPFDA